MYATIRGLHQTLSDLSLMVRVGEVAFCSETLGSSRRPISELMVLGFGRLMLRGEVDQFRGLPVYVRDGSAAYRHCGYECGCCEVIVVKIYSSSHYFLVLCVRCIPKSRPIV